MNQKLYDILGELKMNPIFKMSLGSKELFHSNFLEYLWELDNSRLALTPLSQIRQRTIAEISPKILC